MFYGICSLIMQYLYQYIYSSDGLKSRLIMYVRSQKEAFGEQTYIPRWSTPHSSITLISERK